MPRLSSQACIGNGHTTRAVACDDAVVYMYQEADQMICPVNQIQSEERK